ncbi:MAG: YheU family protein [Oleiphilaceae bacterium]|nr:YheU family protein [Oleiphilaceae bacterium]
MLIPADSLSAEALEGLVEEYCMREHGCNEVDSPLDAHKATVHRKLRSGELLVMYTPGNPNQVASLVTRDQVRAWEQEQSSPGDDALTVDADGGYHGSGFP